MMRRLTILAGALCVIAAISLFRLHLIESQYAAVALHGGAATTTEALPPIPASTSASATIFPGAPSRTAASSTAPAQAGASATGADAASSVPGLDDVSAVNAAARGALVNIICTSPDSAGPVSGSGVIIDPRGVILTNAHVGQYVLLRDSGRVSLSCEVRTGSPAATQWHVRVLYLSTEWMSAHAKDIREQDPLGTGENDFALLRITGTADGSPLPASFPYLDIDTDASAQATGEQVLLASYPAGFLTGLSIMSNLDLVSTIATLGQIFTFSDAHTPDLVSLGGVIVAQGGSSGGAVVDGMKRLIAIIATTSTAGTTGERDLRAITLFHINQRMISETGEGISAYLSGDLDVIEQNFRKDKEPALISELIDALIDPNSALATSTAAAR